MTMTLLAGTYADFTARVEGGPTVDLAVTAWRAEPAEHGGLRTLRIETFFDVGPDRPALRRGAICRVVATFRAELTDVMAEAQPAITHDFGRLAVAGRYPAGGIHDAVALTLVLVPVPEWDDAEDAP
jgi:hypothetical protein